MKTILLLVATAWLGAVGVASTSDPVIMVSDSDKAMNDAIAAARKTLPLFWSKLKTPLPGESDFCLKVRIEDKNGVEYFWCTDITRAEGKLSGVINNDPEIVKNVSMGQRIVFKEEQIGDWLYRRGKKMMGNYTVRVLMREMSKEERADMEAALGPLPPG